MITFKTFATALVCALALGTCSQAQQQPQTISEKVDNFFAENTDKFMGSIEIQENGATVYQKSLGYADIENKIAVNADTKFRIGSITKTFMSVLVLKAAQEGNLSLSDPLKLKMDVEITATTTQLAAQAVVSPHFRSTQRQKTSLSSNPPKS